MRPPARLAHLHIRCVITSCSCARADLCHFPFSHVFGRCPLSWAHILLYRKKCLKNEISTLYKNIYLHTSIVWIVQHSKYVAYHTNCYYWLLHVHNTIRINHTNLGKIIFPLVTCVQFQYNTQIYGDATQKNLWSNHGHLKIFSVHPGTHLIPMALMKKYQSKPYKYTYKVGYFNTAYKKT